MIRLSSSRRTARSSDGLWDTVASMAARRGVLERLYAASRLHTNFFQPSFKLKESQREGAKIIKRYHVPATPYERALAHPKLSKAVKRRLREIYRTLVPVALLAEMRDAEAELGTRVGARAGKLAAAASLPAPTTNAAAFAKRLGNDVHWGAAIIHRRTHKPYKTRVRMPSILSGTAPTSSAGWRPSLVDRAGNPRSPRRTFPGKVRAAAVHHRAALVAIAQTKCSRGDHPSHGREYGTGRHRRSRGLRGGAVCARASAIVPSSPSDPARR